MAFHPVTAEELGRADVFRHFTEEAPCSFSFCADLDVTALYDTAKRRGIKFFAAFLHCLSAEVNVRREFRMSENERGELGWYDTVDPCYTVFHEKDERFSDVWTQFDADFKVFYARYLEDAKNYGGPNMREAKPYAGENLFNVSCMPWASFTGFALNLPKSTRFFSPIFTIGKFFERGGRRLLPFSVQVHHAVCDGYHVCRFLNELQQKLDRFSPET